jgi:hypothetical protein
LQQFYRPLGRVISEYKPENHQKIKAVLLNRKLVDSLHLPWMLETLQLNHWGLL